MSYGAPSLSLYLLSFFLSPPPLNVTLLSMSYGAPSLSLSLSLSLSSSLSLSLSLFLPLSLSLSLPPVQGRERCELVHLSTLLSVQFGTEHPDVSTSLKPTVSQLAQDPTVAVQERAKVFSRSCGGQSLDHTSFLSPCSVLFFLGSLGSFRRLTCTR